MDRWLLEFSTVVVFTWMIVSRGREEPLLFFFFVILRALSTICRLIISIIINKGANYFKQLMKFKDGFSCRNYVFIMEDDDCRKLQMRRLLVVSGEGLIGGGGLFSCWINVSPPVLKAFITGYLKTIANCQLLPLERTLTQADWDIWKRLIVKWIFIHPLIRAEVNRPYFCNFGALCLVVIV